MTNFRLPFRKAPRAIRFLAAFLPALILTHGALAQTAPTGRNTTKGQHAPMPATGSSETWEDRPALLEHFRQVGLRGTVVVFDTQDRRWIAADSSRAFQRFVPASTFKIPNTLIALESGVASGAAQAYPWDGKPRGYTLNGKPFAVPAWNADQTLGSAFRNSTVWVYQQIAREVGAGRMAQSVRSFRYGNADIGTVVDRFWLDGPLQISAVEQVEFLRRLNEGRLPLSAHTVAEGRKTMLREDKPGCRLYAKTGLADATQPAVGWYVGWIERKEGKEANGSAGQDGKPARITYFALNVDLPDGSDAAKREPLVRRALADLGYGIDEPK